MKGNYQIAEIINAYLNRIKIKTITKTYGIASKTIVKILEKNNISKRVGISRINKTIENCIKAKSLENYTYKEIADFCDCSEQYIPIYLKRNNFSKSKKRKYDIREDYFEVIDTEIKAYFLGLLASDGNNFTKNGTITISLQERDSEILEQLSKDIFKDYKKLSHINRLEKNNQDQKRLIINNKKISKDLFKYGITDRKSKTLTLPSYELIPLELYHHFIRGYFDGDGSVHVRVKEKTLHSYFTGSTRAMQQVKSHLETNTSISNKNNIRNHHSSEGLSTYGFSGNINNRIFYNYIYKNCTIKLERKHKKFLEILGQELANLYKRLPEQMVIDKRDNT